MIDFLRGSRRVRVLLLAVCASLPLADAALAGDLYLGGKIAISGGTGKSGGTTNFFDNTGSDTDSSPLFGPTFGYEFPLAELLPLDWDTPLPAWPVRFELEGIFFRDYELVTQGGDPYLTDASSWSLVHNIGIGVPVHGAVSWAFGRVPLLEPMSFDVEVGIGMASTKMRTTNNVLSGGDSDIGFAWQVGAGLGYRLTDRVSVDLGYRYADLGKFNYALRDLPAPDPVGNFSMALASHEFTVGLRVRFFTVASPGEWRFRSRDR